MYLGFVKLVGTSVQKRSDVIYNVHDERLGRINVFPEDFVEAVANYGPSGVVTKLAILSSIILVLPTRIWPATGLSVLR